LPGRTARMGAAHAGDTARTPRARDDQGGRERRRPAWTAHAGEEPRAPLLQDRLALESARRGGRLSLDCRRNAWCARRRRERRLDAAAVGPEDAPVRRRRRYLQRRSRADAGIARPLRRTGLRAARQSPRGSMVALRTPRRRTATRHARPGTRRDVY